MIIRVRAKTRGEEHRIITISDDGSVVECDCLGFGPSRFCSHIDAVLIAGERAMVVDDDHPVADQAMQLVAKVIATPENWKASWRNNMRWRGLSKAGARRPVNRRRDSGKPLVCFTGGKNRAGWITGAVSAGWETIDSPSPFTDVLVAADATGTSRKLVSARQNATVIVTYDEWQVLMMDGVLPNCAHPEEVDSVGRMSPLVRSL